MKIRTVLFIFLLYLGQLYAQKPREIQVDNEPVNWNTANIIVLIVIPTLMLIIGLIARKRYLKKKNELNNQ